MLRLPKSKLLAFRQCERRLWLELYRPDLRRDDGASQAAFAAGHHVGDLARRLYDPDGRGVLLDPDGVGERILQNPELVRRILESEAHAGEAQTAPEFLAWLASVGDQAVEPD